MTEPRYYASIRTLHETSDVAEANALLAQGWELVGIKEKTLAVAGPEGKPQLAAGPAYVLGLAGPPREGPAEARPPRSEACKCGLHGQCALEGCGCTCHVGPPLVRKGPKLRVPSEEERPPSTSDAIGGGTG